MRPRRIINTAICVFALSAVVVLCGGCGKTNSSSSGLTKTNSSSSGPVNLTDYFPMTVGTEWVYEITIGNVNPLQYSVVNWPISESSAVASENRGYLGLALLSKKHSGSYTLILKVKKQVNKEGLLRRPGGVEIQVVRDDLQIYNGADRVFWFVEPGESAAEEVAYYPLSSPIAPASDYVVSDGFGIRNLMFVNQPGTSKSISLSSNAAKKSPDSLLSVGQSHNKRLLFLRSVKPAAPHGNDLNQGFTESTVYEQGVGLVSLQQNVGTDGKLSMTWKLTKFTRGS